MNKFNIRSEKEKIKSNGDTPTDFKQFSLFKDWNHGYWLCVVVNADVRVCYKFCFVTCEFGYRCRCEENDTKWCYIKQLSWTRCTFDEVKD